MNAATYDTTNLLRSSYWPVRYLPTMNRNRKRQWKVAFLPRYYAMKTQTYKSDIFAAIHETASDLSDAGLMHKSTLRSFDALCLTPVAPLVPEEIKALRVEASVSQAVFARYLNVTVGLVSQWERGEKSPSGASLKLLSLVKVKGLSAVA